MIVPCVVTMPQMHTAVFMIGVFWSMTPYRLVITYRCFTGGRCLQFQGHSGSGRNEIAWDGGNKL
jgi:hypothetical protein